jgi:hypothetical protein
VNISLLSPDTLTFTVIGAGVAVFPAEDLYPASDVYPGDGTTVLSAAADTLTFTAITAD